MSWRLLEWVLSLLIHAKLVNREMFTNILRQAFFFKIRLAFRLLVMVKIWKIILPGWEMKGNIFKFFSARGSKSRTELKSVFISLHLELPNLLSKTSARRECRTRNWYVYLEWKGCLYVIPAGLWNETDKRRCTYDPFPLCSPSLVP